MGEGTIAGIDAQKLEPWLAAHIEGTRAPFSYRLITGGRSNLTFEVTDAAGARMVLRRPPLGHLLPTAHDVLREARIISAVAGTGVPVPPVLATCDDPDINGGPFFVMRFVDGVVLDSVEKVASLDNAGRVQLADHLVDVLARLHAVDVDAVGLGDLSKREGYLERQVRRWVRQWEGSKTRELPLIDDVAARLQREMPEQRGVSIVHGDYRFGNTICDLGRREVAAVLDWELCALGDPLADVGYLGVYWFDGGRGGVTNDPTGAGGFPGYDDIVQRYAKVSGREVGNLGYYRGFAAWRLAIIAEGVASRHREHHPEDVDALRMSQLSVQRLTEFAAECLG